MVKDLTPRRVLSLSPHLSCIPLRPFDLALGCMVFSFISSWKPRGSKRYAENAPTMCPHCGTTPELLLSAGSKTLSQSHEWADRLIAHMTVN